MTEHKYEESTPPVGEVLPDRNAAGDEGAVPAVVGLLADPELAAAEVARYLARTLPAALAEHLGEAERREVRVAYERLPAGSSEYATMIDHAEFRRDEWGAGLVVCLTDMPLRNDRRPVVADLDSRRRVAVVSLPALGGMRLRGRVQRLVVQLVAELVGHQDGAQPGARDGSPSRRRLNRARRLTRQFEGTRQFERLVPDQTPVSVRIVATRGRLRLLFGMVRANRPWRLATGLSAAMTAACAISAFFIINSTVWRLSDALGPLRLSLTTVVSLAALVGWLIINHRMWEHPHHQTGGTNREQAVFYNLSTVLTLTIGVACLYVGVFLALLAAGLLILSAGVVGSYLGHPPSLATYLDIAWLTTSAATIGGALGSSLDSDQAVRAAAYSYREGQRHSQREGQGHQQPDEPVDAG